MPRKSSSQSNTDLPQLVLASASPRRRILLTEMGVEFEVLNPNIDETIISGEAPRVSVLRLAQEKASAAQQSLANNNIFSKVVLAADTIVCQGDNIFGKPKDKSDAIRIWSQLSDSEHQVMTGVCLLSETLEKSCVAVTQIRFTAISEAQMHAYWETGEPLDKAGAYAIQGAASAWVKHLHGSYSNVVGLPLYEVNNLLQTIDLNWL